MENLSNRMLHIQNTIFMLTHFDANSLSLFVVKNMLLVLVGVVGGEVLLVVGDDATE